MKGPFTLFWFRRDLRLEDNTGLYHALRSGKPVQCLFIFDSTLLDKLDPGDARVSFIHATLESIDKVLKSHGSKLLVRYGKPAEVWQELLDAYGPDAVYANHDYEPYARKRDEEIRQTLNDRGIPFHTSKDQVIFEKDEVVKADHSPYTVYTPYMKKWLAAYSEGHVNPFSSDQYLDKLLPADPEPFIKLDAMGFRKSSIRVPDYELSERLIQNYKDTRDLPYLMGTSMAGPYLRFGLIGIRSLVERTMQYDPTFLKELIWREFFMQILWHFPAVREHSFKRQYDRIGWLNDESHFQRWCDGMTGYPLVDAGMRQLRATGFMHNRVRMVTASFLCKHLLTDWRWGEAWFAKHLLDYELASNNGNWQWAAGTGCDAAPYFRVFNPMTQQEKFDPGLKYVKQWLPEYGTKEYPSPVVDHRMARERAIAAYKRALNP